jgi:hypothetical protein
MTRAPQEGTPRDVRAKRYVFPSRSRVVLWSSIGVGALIMVGLFAGYAAGFRRTLSPGNVASAHARIDLKCAQCHEAGEAVTAVRCERCHDPSGSDRLTHAAHVLLGSRDIRKAESATETACATCHTEHKGRDNRVAAVDDRECASCHSFSTLARHPEFASVRAQATAGVGLKFNHDRHVIEAESTRGAACQICHEQTGDRIGFVPMTFERHCASCHAPEGTFAESDPILGELLVPPASLPADWRSRTAATLAPRGRKQVASQLRHRDGWVLFNALRIRQSIDRDGESAERLILRGRIAYLEQLLTVRPVHQASPQELQAAVATLQGEIAAIDQRLVAGSSPDDTALSEMTTAIQALAGQLAQADAAAAADFKTIASQTPAGGSEPPGPSGNDDREARFERRKAELLKLLDTVASRTPAGPMADRASALRAEVERLTPAAAGESTQDSGPLLDRLTALDDVLGTVRTIPDPGVQLQLAQVDVLRSYSQQRITAGLSAADFETRKVELLGLLDAVERRGGPAVRLRVSPLRQRVLALRPGSLGDTDLSRTRRQLQRQLERVQLELELAARPDEQEPPPTQDARVDPVAIERLLGELRAQLADLERAPRMTAAQSADEREQRRNELDALLSRCLKCHEYDPSGVRLASVRAAEPVMPRSIFNHAPHTTLKACETCHGSVRISKLATDINVPGVDNCTSCHAPSRARSDCETCHVYHPVSPASLLMVQR